MAAQNNNKYLRPNDVNKLEGYKVTKTAAEVDAALTAAYRTLIEQIDGDTENMILTVVAETDDSGNTTTRLEYRKLTPDSIDFRQNFGRIDGGDSNESPSADQDIEGDSDQ